MKKFTEFLEEAKVNELRSLRIYNQNNKRGSFHAGGKSSHRLLIFDIDDTLLTGEVYIHILDKNTGEEIGKVNSNQFNTYRLKPNEEFDFSEFADPDIFEKNKITHYFGTMKREYERGTHICLLTARGGKEVGEMIRNYFLKRGIDIKEELVICINSEDAPYTGTTAERKSEAMQDLYDAGYDTMIFFDDNEENLEVAEETAEKIGFELVTRKADINRWPDEIVDYKA